MRSVVVLLLVTCGLIVASPALGQERTGHVDWESWSFDWEIKDNTGLALLDVSYNGELVLTKASMPVIRVKYVKERKWWNPFTWFGSRAVSGRCGPFQDRLRWQDLVKISNCNDEWVCKESFDQAGVKWLELGAYARIGAYHIYQAWYLTSDGEIHPTVHSRGLSCNTDHIHHPYWRLDFDIAGNGLDQVFVRDDVAPDEGWGRGWRKYRNERNDVKKSTGDRVWFVRDQPSGHGVWVFPRRSDNPAKDDGVADSFADKDMAVRRDHDSEDLPWTFGARGHLGFDEDNEGVQEQDIVFWYVAHLSHEADEGPFKWLAIGPTLRVQR